MFETRCEETGQIIKLCGIAIFEGNTLTALERVLTSASQLVQGQPETWRVQVGTQVSPEPGTLFKTVERGEFLELLARFREMVARAEELGRPVVCFGD